MSNLRDNDETENHKDLLEYYLSLSQKEKDMQFISTMKAAEMAGVSQRTIQDWIHWGMFLAIKSGKNWRVDVGAFHKYLKIRYGNEL